MNDDLQTLLRTSKIFSSLSKRTCLKLLPKFERVEIERGEVLYYQGDASDSVEILLSGKLEAILTIAGGENKSVGEINPGETVGELGALSGEFRSATVVALKNSVLFKLPSEAFVELCHEYPSVLYAIINPIVSRSQRIIRTFSTEKFKKHIAIIPANDEVDLTTFIEKMTELTEDLHSLVVLSDYSKSVAETSPQKIQHFIDDAKAKNLKKLKQRILYLLKPEETTLAKYCFERADMIYIVADKNAPTLINNYVMSKVTQFVEITKSKPELIMLHSPHTKIPRDTASWLQLTDFGLHHHIRINHHNDYQRLLRFIRNKAVGLVLSGGGTRGWAHAGAIKALTEAGVPIDAIGGTSVGSIIAASYALTLSDEETLAHFQEIIDAGRYSVSWRNLTWPAISLFNAKGLTTIIQKIYGNQQIEDLWLPYFCVSTNLAKNTETIHYRGCLWEQIRSSISIPGVIPPMVQDGELHFDGGLLNNLPVDVMRKITTQRGTIIAIELVAYNKDEHKYNFPPILTFWQTFLGKFNLRNDYKFPRFIDTFLKSLLAGSSLKAKQNSMGADILIGLDLSRYPMLHSNRKQEHRIIEIGYEATMHQIKNMKRKSQL